jgi:uncharacterized protein YuzE
MKVVYDSEADVLSIDLRVVHRWDEGENVDDDCQCNVAFFEGQVANVELLSPSRHLDLLPSAAERYGLDAQGLNAAAEAGLAAPDREIVIYVGRRLPGSS